ncbi:MAG TPA: transglycosylase domain-containing protein [Bacteroidia bacterium]|nr:transglycosylase domain-containing protein [Bacteroidia bacterium]HQW21774.1 transglycosylase domain-containing protein [Bacteroidia bacterium]
MPKSKPSFKKYIRLFWVLVSLPFLFLLFVLFLASKGFIGEELPTFEDLENPKSNLASEVLSNDLTIIGKYYIQNRTNIHYYDLSPNLINALKATEDIRFENHSGIDLRGLIRVVFKAGSAGGGSTLTQQLAKNLFHEKPKSKMDRVIQKIQEWIISVQLERRYTKEEILAMYLNTVEFSSNAFGIKSATQTYFAKTPDSLNIQESAVLVGMLQAPTKFNPARNPKNSLARRNIVLSQMNKYNFINDHEFDSIKALPTKLNYQMEDHNFGLATYFREVLRTELLSWCKEHINNATGKPYNLYTDGLKIYTTINSKMQRYAEEAMREHMKEIQKKFNEHWKGKAQPWDEHPEIVTDGMKKTDRYIAMKAAKASQKEIDKAFKTKVKMTVFTWNGEVDTMLSPLDSLKYYKKFLQCGFMSMDPISGAVRAWVGGNDYRYFKYDHVKEGKRQVGSTFKPFLYTLAMQEGYSPCYKIPNVKVTFDLPTGETWSPDNADGKYGGMLTLKEGLAESVNCVSAYLMKQFGPQAMIDIVRRMGVTSPIDAVPAICLGTPDVSVYEMVGAYSTFANKGVWTEPTYLMRIEDKNGNVLQDFVPRKVEAVNEETAFLMLNLMQGVVQYGTGARLRGQYKMSNAIAGKTGTTQNQSDGWFMGITPDLVSGCWVGAEDRIVHFRTLELGQGARTALPIWALYMQKVYADKELNLSKREFTPPAEKLSVELNCDKYVQPGSGGEGTFDKDNF